MFKAHLIFGVVALGSIAVMSGPSVGQTKTKDGKTRAATVQEYALLAKYKEMPGVIESTSPGSIKLRVEYDHATQSPSTANKNPNQNTQLQNLQRQLQQAQSIKNPAQRQQKVAQLQAQMAQLQQQNANQKAVQAAQNQVVVKDHIDFDLKLLDNAPIRRTDMIIETDDKGEAKDPALDKLPGYAAKFSDLSKGDSVRVYLAAPKAGGTDNHPRVRMVLIVKDVEMKSKN